MTETPVPVNEELQTSPGVSLVVRSQTGHLTDNLLGLARAGSGQIRRRTRLAVNLNFDLSDSGFFRGDNRNAAAGERTTPDITRRVAGGEVIVEVAGAQVAAANPSGSDGTRVVVVEPAFVVGDAQDPGRRCQRLIGDSRKRLRHLAGRHRQPLIVLNERQ